MARRLEETLCLLGQRGSSRQLLVTSLRIAFNSAKEQPVRTCASRLGHFHNDMETTSSSSSWALLTCLEFKPEARLAGNNSREKPFLT